MVADISAVPCTRKNERSGELCFTQKLAVVLLVGHMELKAQIRWIDPGTVSMHS